MGGSGEIRGATIEKKNYFRRCPRRTKMGRGKKRRREEKQVIKCCLFFRNITRWFFQVVFSFNTFASSPAKLSRGSVKFPRLPLSPYSHVLRFRQVVFNIHPL